MKQSLSLEPPPTLALQTQPLDCISLLPSDLLSTKLRLQDQYFQQQLDQLKTMVVQFQRIGQKGQK